HIQESGLSSRQDVHLHLLLNGCGSLGESPAELLAHALELIVGLLISQEAFLEPAFLSPWAAHPHKSFVLHPVHYFQPLAVVHHSHLVVNGGHAIAQRRFGNGDIDELGFPGGPAGTSSQRQKAGGDEQQCPKEQSDFSVGSPYNVGIAHWFANKYSSPNGT